MNRILAIGAKVAAARGNGAASGGGRKVVRKGAVKHSRGNVRMGALRPPAGGRLRIDDDDIIEDDEAEASPFTTSRLVAAALAAVVCGVIVHNAVTGQPGERREALKPAESGFAETASLNDLEPDFAPLPTSLPATHVRVEVPEEADTEPTAEGDRMLREIQSALKTLGHYAGPVDGRETSELVDAIISGERQLGFEPTGRATQALAERFRLEQEIVLALGGPVQPPVSTDRPAGEMDVSTVQRGLVKLGYDPGPADGALGRKTRDAIRLFERDRRLPETGSVTPALLAEVERLVAGAQ